MRKMSVTSALGATFAIIAAIAVFLPWISDSLFDANTWTSGWELFHDKFFSEGLTYYFLPLVGSILAIGSWVVFMFLPNGNVTRLVTVILGIAVAALAIFTYFEAVGFLEDNGFTDMVMGWGLYVVMASGILSAICGAVARE